MTSLHVTYRPKTFEEVLGQDKVVKSLKRVVKDGKARTFLFSGPSGCGKTTLARILANTFANGKGTAVNIIEIDAATHTGVDAMRSITATSNYRAIGDSPNKTIICDEAHKLSSSAWDSLLKVIEEPPAHMSWMFCTTNPGKLPATVKTRCLPYELKAVSEEILLELLVDVADKEELTIEDEVLEAIAEASGGSPKQSLVYLEACKFAENANDARNLMQSAHGSKEVIDLARWLLQGRNHNWAEAAKILNGLEVIEPEGIRIVVCNYLSAVLLKTKSDKEAIRIFNILEEFEKSYDPLIKNTPLLLSIARAVNLGRMP